MIIQILKNGLKIKLKFIFVYEHGGPPGAFTLQCILRFVCKKYL